MTTTMKPQVGQERMAQLGLERDPMGYVDGMNTYQAMADNPINRVDPMGLQATSMPVSNGKFTVNFLGGDAMVQNGQRITTSQGSVEFVPNANCPQTKLIRLVQIVRTTMGDGGVKDFKWNDIRDQAKTTADNKKGILGGFHIEFSPANVVPGKPVSIYFRDHYPNKDKSHDGKNDGADAVSASLFDTPTMYIGYTEEFETYAVYEDAAGKVQVLGGIKWSIFALASGASVVPGEEIVQPSATFTEALRIFNDLFNKTK